MNKMHHNITGIQLHLPGRLFLGVLLIAGMLGLSLATRAQQSTPGLADLYGHITDEKGKPIEFATISVVGLPGGTTTDAGGHYKLVIPAGKEMILAISHVGFETYKVRVLLKEGDHVEVSRKIKRSATELPDVEVVDRGREELNILRIDPKTVSVIPSMSSGVEAVLKTLPGVYSSNELSSQYSVRGGNYDENLVYVNDVEVYRPFLVRSGQQEGLSFVNSDLVSSIAFSAGGFDARYGDKMSSVLDIKYKRPTTMSGSVTGSLLGGAVHLESGSDSSRFSYLLGIRQKSNQYVLKGLDTRGDYKPSFTDVQAYVSYDLAKKWELSFLGNYARNRYWLVPQTRKTDFGTINDALRLTIYFDGQEVDRYETVLGAFTTTFKPNNNTRLKLIASAFNTAEDEAFDVLGQYWLDQLETDFGKDEFGDVAYNRGVGSFLNHARNALQANVFSLEHIGYRSWENKSLRWGVQYKHEAIDDHLKEWVLLDSAGFTIPRPPDSMGYTYPSLQPDQPLVMSETLFSDNHHEVNKMSAYIQQSWALEHDARITNITLGVRAFWWDLNNQLRSQIATHYSDKKGDYNYLLNLGLPVMLSPRATITHKPNWEKDVSWRLSTGLYQQPPFYREFRDFDGALNKDVKPQSSVHFVLGADWNMLLWGRPFKYVGEAYYKFMYNLIPYEIDNVRIRYFANNQAYGYAAGLDMRLNGEFVNGVDSWVSLSVMQTREDIIGDFYYDYFNSEGQKIIAGYTFNNRAVDSVQHTPGYIPRPTDQRVNFNLFFQDYLPKNPTYKMHLNLVFGTGLPFGPPTHERYKATLRIPPYRRVDIGFSKQIKGEDQAVSGNSVFRHFRSVWLSAEVFNLLQIHNTISYVWIKDVTNRTYAIPNFLTPRQLNLKLIAKF